ncbi:MAG TPA: hypothetical protein VN222_00300, partial [Novosphingobium sp.]|nr:hypothetical protein [Novosphingobium sp.]
LIALGMTVESSTSFINFGAFTAFTAVNLAVVCTAVRQGRRPVGADLWLWYVAPLLGAAIDAWLLTRLERPALVLGGIWLLAGLGILTWLTGGFRRQPPALHIDQH